MGQVIRDRQMIRPSRFPFKKSMIMKSCPDVEAVREDSPFLITKATEMFTTYLAQESNKNSSDKGLNYESLSKVVTTDSKLEFLAETVPKKITWAECKQLMEEKNKKKDNDLI